MIVNCTIYRAFSMASVVIALSAATAVSFATIAFAEPVTVTDQRGATVRLHKPAERIVTIPIPHASIVMAVDSSADRIVGMHPSAKAAMEQGLLGRMFPKATSIRSDITGQGFMPNVETLLALRPDLVVQWANQGPGLIEAVERTGLPVVGVNFGTEAYIREAITMYGGLIGRPERARAILAHRDEVRARIDAALREVHEADKPRVLQLQQALGGFQAAARGSWQDVAIGIAGGRNVAAELKDYPAIGVEQIVAWAPDVILLNSFEEKLSPEFIYANPVFSRVPAVLNRRVYKLPLGGQRWDPPSHESPLAWVWQATLFHPDRVHIDLRQEMVSAYKLLYGHTLTAAEIDGILFMERHAQAANYERFRAR